MLSKLFGRRSPEQRNRPRPEDTNPSVPIAGNIYAFHTMPINEFSAPETGRWAVFKVLGLDERTVVVAVLDGIWNAQPSMKDAAKASILKERRFAWTGQQAVFGVNAEWWPSSELRDQTLLGISTVSTQDAALAAQVMSFAPGSRMSTLRAANHAAEGEWRWKHDREAYSEEVERKRLMAAEQREAQEERYRTRLSTLTWDRLLAETPFQRWARSPPFPPAEFTSEARKVIHETCRKLRALGPKPSRPNVRAALKSCVQWFNDADERAGGIIETEEREDICAVLEEMAHVARQRALVDEIDAWRSW